MVGAQGFILTWDRMGWVNGIPKMRIFYETPLVEYIMSSRPCAILEQVRQADPEEPLGKTAELHSTTRILRTVAAPHCPLPR